MITHRLDPDHIPPDRLRASIHRPPAPQAEPERLRRLYIAGPMTGLADYNRPAFHAAAAFYRGQGYHVESPAENTVQPEGTEDAQWSAYMRQSIRQMLTCDVVAALDGWEHSRGAFIELHLARLLHIRCHADCDLRKSFLAADGSDLSDQSDQLAGGAA